MGDTGKELGADCAQLWQVGAQFYPDIAREFAEAASGLSAASSYFAFMRDASLGTGGQGAYPQWSAVVDLLDDCLATTARNLNETGEALVLAANTYSRTDAAAAQEYAARQDVLREEKRP